MLKPGGYHSIKQKSHLKRTLMIGVFLGLILINFQGCFSIVGILPWRYEAEPIVGRIIDNETGEPIAGVAVVALWFLADPFEQGGTKRFEVIETVT